MSAATPPTPTPPLANFIAYAVYRTRVDSPVIFATLYLLHRLKARFPAARGSSGHRLFISAVMIASKVICDDTYSNKSWVIVGSGMFALRDLNQMEREMLSYLEWDINIQPEALKEFENKVRHDFKGLGPYPEYLFPRPSSSPMPSTTPYAVRHGQPLPAPAFTAPHQQPPSITSDSPLPPPVSVHAGAPLPRWPHASASTPGMIESPEFSMSTSISPASSKPSPTTPYDNEYNAVRIAGHGRLGMPVSSNGPPPTAAVQAYAPASSAKISSKPSPGHIYVRQNPCLW